ncbi:hypothetical protein FGO68_gene14115 [Halteria grandinella]|uniref:Uncharacterized protein n=1 Tax=Halteria grandinella TaxID=5974 RepID=A0A8J8SYR2_HALGN|nr:hypothetical protein FGO68_gene14115 [Halteria grandinella]
MQYLALVSCFALFNLANACNNYAAAGINLCSGVTCFAHESCESGYCSSSNGVSGTCAFNILDPTNILIIVGGIVLAIIACCICCCCTRSRRDNNLQMMLMAQNMQNQKQAQQQPPLLMQYQQPLPNYQLMPNMMPPQQQMNIQQA